MRINVGWGLRNNIEERERNYEKSMGLVVHIETAIALGKERRCHDLTCTG